MQAPFPVLLGTRAVCNATTSSCTRLQRAARLTGALVPPACPQELGAAALSKRPTSCMLLLPQPIKGKAADDAETKEFSDAFADVERRVKAAMPVF